MKNSSNAQLKPLRIIDLDEGDDALPHDPRWRLALRVVEGPHFSRSALLSKFLLFVVREVIEGRQNTISEHKIGVTVFGRAPQYRTDEDNIVRNYARQLRRRLADHFGGEGKDSPMRIEMPVGGYVPSFPVASPQLLENGAVPIQSAPVPANRFPHPLHSQAEPRATRVEGIWWRGRGVLVVLFILLVLGTGWAAAYHFLVQQRTHDPMRTLWRNVMPATQTTLIVPADAGLNLLEDLSHRSVPLADYINGAYESIPTAAIDPHASQDLHAQQYTDFVSLEIVGMIARQPEYNSQRVHSRFPRDVRLNDLKNSNALIIGSSSSNPWASIADAHTNFAIVTRPDMEGAEIINRDPQPGERNEYVSNWNEPAHESFALVLFQPNLNRTGSILLIEGLDVAGTQAAAEVLLQADLIAPVLRRAERPDGTLRYFEILLRTTSIQSNAEGTQILASRIE